MMKILVVDDHLIVREGLKRIVSSATDMVVADEAGDGVEALNKALLNDYDLVLLDISLPGRDGLDVLKELKEKKPKLPVLILSIHPEEQYAVRTLKAGGCGYLTKTSAADELIAAIRKVASGGKYVSASLAEQLASELNADATQPLHHTLSDREYQVMYLIALAKTPKEIAAQLKLSAKTVHTYRSRIMQKMRMKTNAELIRYAIENKLVP